jgi:EmrB/QacA subfamily drug resistance transporter
MGSTTSQGAIRQRVNPWLVFSATSLSAILVMLNLGALNVALPAISRYYHASASLSSWILLSYMLVNTILILVFGQLSDVYGRKTFFLIGTFVFTIVSFAIGFATNVWIFLILRVLQAAGGALIISNNSALITDAFPKEKLGKGLGMNVLVASAAQLLGPVIGGLIASAFGWRWVFWSGVPVGIVGLFWGIWVLRRLPTRGSGNPVDWLGGVLIFISLSGLILALSEGGTLGWGSFPVLLGFVMFLIITPLFVWLEFHVSSPMFDFSLFRDIPYAMGNISAFLNAFTRVSVVLLVSLYLQSVLHYDPSWAGLAVLPVTVGMLIASPLSGNLSNRLSPRLLSTSGLGLSAIGLIIILIALNPVAAYIWSGIGMLFVGLGSGFFMTPNTKAILTSVPYDHRGFANGLRSMLQNMGQVLSTAISLTIVAAALPNRLKDAVVGGTITSMPNKDVQLMTVGYHWAFLTLLVATIAGVIVSFLRGPVSRQAA